MALSEFLNSQFLIPWLLNAEILIPWFLNSEFLMPLFLNSQFLIPWFLNSQLPIPWFLNAQFLIPWFLTSEFPWTHRGLKVFHAPTCLGWSWMVQKPIVSKQGRHVTMISNAKLLITWFVKTLFSYHVVTWPSSYTMIPWFLITICSSSLFAIPVKKSVLWCGGCCTSQFFFLNIQLLKGTKQPIILPQPHPDRNWKWLWLFSQLPTWAQTFTVSVSARSILGHLWVAPNKQLHLHLPLARGPGFHL